MLMDLLFNESAALLRRQGVNVKGLLKTAPAKEEPQPYIDVTGNLQVLYVLS
jgi:gelsolin